MAPAPEHATSKEYSLVSLLLLKYKHYVLPECNLSAIKQELYAAVKKFADIQHATEQIIVASQEQDDSLFGYLSAARDTSLAVQQLKSGISEEIDSYLHCEDTSQTMLHQYPAVKKAFLFYNCSLPSSAAVERLFLMRNCFNV
jgi:hypothetical protein